MVGSLWDIVLTIDSSRPQSGINRHRTEPTRRSEAKPALSCNPNRIRVDTPNPWAPNHLLDLGPKFMRSLSTFNPNKNAQFTSSWIPTISKPLASEPEFGLTATPPLTSARLPARAPRAVVVASAPPVARAALGFSLEAPWRAWRWAEGAATPVVWGNEKTMEGSGAMEVEEGGMPPVTSTQTGDGSKKHPPHGTPGRR